MIRPSRCNAPKGPVVPELMLEDGGISYQRPPAAEPLLSARIALGFLLIILAVIYLIGGLAVAAAIAGRDPNPALSPAVSIAIKPL